jgi:nitrogen fixation protein FixH
MSHGFTGRHMLAVMISFFGLIIAVNLTMARLASDTFGGSIVANSYVASQRFNGWLQAARDQKALGWQSDLALDGRRHVVLTMDGPGFVATGSAHHPLGRAPDVVLTFANDGAGRLISSETLPGGRWQVRITVSRDGKVLKLAETLQ